MVEKTEPTYSWNEARLPWWVRQIMDERHLPRKFKVSELTPKEMRDLGILFGLIGLVNRGLVKVTRAVDGELIFRLSEVKD
jgi:hypothetical protein